MLFYILVGNRTLPFKYLNKFFPSRSIFQVVMGNGVRIICFGFKISWEILSDDPEIQARI